jgi:hypothetical protein
MKDMEPTPAKHREPIKHGLEHVSVPLARAIEELMQRAGCEVPVEPKVEEQQ